VVPRDPNVEFATVFRASAVHRTDAQPPRRWHATFGPFQLSPDERLLHRDGAPVRLGGRALDLLIVLVENAGAVVGKKELLAKVWGEVVVDEGSLRFNMYAVRKALGDGEGGQRYIVNTANKGYTFVANVERHDAGNAPRPPASAVISWLPALGSAIVGRDADVEAIVASLMERRLVSIVGSGGTGKTTVAIASAHIATRHFDRDVYFVDLSQISDVGLVRATVASAIGLQSARDDLAVICAHLAESKALIVLDCCEHVISGAAELAEYIVRNCPAVHVLATSREPLLAQGEFVFRLQPLAFPPQGEGTTAQAAMAYPAVRLFVARVAASGSGFDLTDRNAPLVSQLCRELDGIALAIELAAGRMEALGLEAITSHFDASVKLMWHGRRTAVPRHQTLGATLDWSFNLLADDEKRLLRRLSVFAGTFSMDAAIEVCCFDYEKSVAIELIAGLVSKSLVNVDAGGAVLRYRMLDTTKFYSWKRLTECGESAAVAERFSGYFSRWARECVAQPLGSDALDPLKLELPNLRAALEWYSREAADPSDAVELAASFCPLLLHLSQLAECSRWAQAALQKMPQAFVGSRIEARLQAAVGQSLMFTGGDAGVAEGAFRRSVEVAEGLGEFRSALHALNGYAVLLHRDGRFTEALTIARKAQSLLPRIDDAEARAIVDSLLGVALHFVGHVSEASQHWERSAAHSSGSLADTTTKLGFDHHIRTMCGVARSLWLTGRYARATAVADETMAKARDAGHAVTYCIALIWAGSVYSYQGNAERLREICEALEGVAKRHSFAPYISIASATRGQILIVEGRTAEGIERMRGAVEALHASRYEMVTNVFLTIMARGLSELSLHAASLALCDEVAQRIETGGDFLRMPELLTVRGRVLAAAGDQAGATRSFLAAMELARSQEVVPGQLRAAIALAQQMMGTGKGEEADRLLRPHVVAAGGETSPDLVLARSLLR